MGIGDKEDIMKTYIVRNVRNPSWHLGEKGATFTPTVFVSFGEANACLMRLAQIREDWLIVECDLEPRVSAVWQQGFSSDNPRALELFAENATRHIGMDAT